MTRGKSNDYFKQVKREWIRWRGPGRCRGVVPALPQGLHLDPQAEIDTCLACTLPDCRPRLHACRLRAFHANRGAQ